MRQGTFKLSMVLGGSPTSHPDRVKICREMGVRHAISFPGLRDVGRDQYAAKMKQHKQEWAEAGLGKESRYRILGL